MKIVACQLPCVPTEEEIRTIAQAFPSWYLPLFPDFAKAMEMSLVLLDTQNVVCIGYLDGFGYGV
jgi:hypothetical protein